MEHTKNSKKIVGNSTTKQEIKARRIAKLIKKLDHSIDNEGAEEKVEQSSEDDEEEYEITQVFKFQPDPLMNQYLPYDSYRGWIDEDYIIGGPPIKYDLENYINKLGLEIEENYKLLCRKYGGENQEECDRIRDFRMKSLEQTREQMESLIWKAFFKYTKIAEPKKST